MRVAHIWRVVFAHKRNSNRRASHYVEAPEDGGELLALARGREAHDDECTNADLDPRDYAIREVAYWGTVVVEGLAAHNGAEDTPRRGVKSAPEGEAR